jgi:hypothetical protein
LAATRSKRWNGNVDTLPAEYLNGIVDKMADYGERVQFSLATGPLPSYQVINSFGKAMAFDRNHHLLRPQENDFAAGNVSADYTMDQLKAIIAGERMVKEARTRTVKVVKTREGGTRTTVAKLNDQFAALRYEYFKNNRDTLPPTIAEHSDEITELMKNGKSVEEAFAEVVGKYY